MQSEAYHAFSSPMVVHPTVYWTKVAASVQVIFKNALSICVLANYFNAWQQKPMHVGRVSGVLIRSTR